MKVKVLTLPFDAGAGGFAGEELDAFMEENEVIDVRQEFFVHEQSPWLMLVLAYRPGDGGVRSDSASHVRMGERDTRRSRSKPRTDPTAQLDPVERARYERVRQWRNARAVQDGVSPFVILTNAQAAAVARANPASLSSLQQVDGVGEGRIARYGEDLLRVLSSEVRGADPVSKAQVTESSSEEVHDGG